MHELVWSFDEKLTPSGCFGDGAWRPLPVVTNDFGYVVHEDQTADLVVVQDVQYFDLQTSFLSVCI